MKKTLSLVAALAFIGMCASCQKENSVVPEQPAAEQNIITINTQSLKGEATAEPLLALGESLAKGETKSELGRFAVDVLKEFLQTVGNLIGANDEAPSHSLKYFGSWKNFGYAVDQIRQLSYNITDAVDTNPFVKIQLGNARDLKVGNLEIMPISNFRLYCQYFEKMIKPGTDSLVIQEAASLSGSLGKEQSSYEADVMVSNALVVKFTYKHQTYLFMIYAQDMAGRATKFIDDGVLFGLVYGDYVGTDEALVKIYNSCKMTDGVPPIQMVDFPVIPSLALRYSANSRFESTDVLYHNYLLNYVSERNLVSVRLTNASEYGEILRTAEGDWLANLYSEDKDAVKSFFCDFLKARFFGCSQSECKSLSAQFYKVFPMTGAAETTSNSMILLIYNNIGEEARLLTYLALEPQAASGMLWKPALGFLDSGMEDAEFVSFQELNQMSKEQKSLLWSYMINNYAGWAMQTEPWNWSGFDD